MIDLNYYRQYENKAKDNLPTWVIAQKYNVDIFEKVGFPARINNIQQTVQIFDSMQENRFTKFMDEIGGFTKKELDIFIDVCIENIKFQISYFPTQKPFIPFDILMNSFLLYKKFNTFNPNSKRILEIGPGSSSFSFFIKKFKHLKEYSYTDACESFYLLQNNINFFLFRDNFNQKVLEHNKDKSFIDKSNTNYLQGGLEERFYIDKIQNDNLICNAYPWWKLGELNDSKSKFDIITANANLTEFNEGALNDYLTIINNKLSEDGVFFAQCTGGGYQHGSSTEFIFNKFYEYKLAVVFYLRYDNSYTCKKTGEYINKHFALDNLMLINQNHPLFSKYYKKPDFAITCKIPIQEKYLEDSFFPSFNKMQEKTKYTKKELQTIITEKFQYQNNCCNGKE